MTKPPLIEPYSWTIGSIANNISYVNCGVKPIAAFETHNLYLEDCVREIKNAGLFYTLSSKGETHTLLYLYKEHYLEHVINYTLGLPYNENIFLAWVEGKMFGYSEENIGKYIYEKVNNQSLVV